CVSCCTAQSASTESGCAEARCAVTSVSKATTVCLICLSLLVRQAVRPDPSMLLQHELLAQTDSPLSRPSRRPCRATARRLKCVPIEFVEEIPHLQVELPIPIRGGVGQTQVIEVVAGNDVARTRRARLVSVRLFGRVRPIQAWRQRAA